MKFLRLLPKKPDHLFLRFLLALLMPVTPMLHAAQYVDQGEYRIHYTTFSSMLIPSNVAAVHEITRAENRIVLNVSARNKEEAVPIRIEGYITNLLNQRFDLNFKEVKESNAIYYLAHHLSLEQDILRFDITVTAGDEPDVSIRILRRYD
ncbi:MAG: hypothetical protein ACI8Z1_000397 [Candidatus Azotimanducaceae bacterium]|jgi:hypothetical protein